MEELDVLSAILDSWNKPVVFVDTDHTIRYMNVPAQEKYAKWGDVIGKSIFHCHSEKSCAIIKNAYSRFENDEDEVMIASNEKHRVYMRRVKDAKGKLLGYIERYEPPLGK